MKILTQDIQGKLAEIIKKRNNKKEDKLWIQHISYVALNKLDTYSPVSDYEFFYPFENDANIFDIDYDKFESEYNEIITSDNCKNINMMVGVKNHY